MQETSGRLITRKQDGMGWIVFSNPARRNAMSFEMWRALPLALDTFARDPEVRAVVVTGDGESFASGADISEFETRRANPAAAAEYNDTLDAAYRGLLECPKPTIARIRRICVGGGLGLALSCDVRWCSDDTVFRMPAGRLGLGYAFEGVKRMVDVIGLANAADIFFSARKFDAAEAQRIGVVNTVRPVATFDAEFAGYCALVAANAPLTLAAAKRAILESSKDPGERNMALVNAMYEACFESEDYAEGRRAFLEKREPVFRGR